jgi:hypothetical protein
VRHAWWQSGAADPSWTTSLIVPPAIPCDGAWTASRREHDGVWILALTADPSLCEATKVRCSR